MMHDASSTCHEEGKGSPSLLLIHGWLADASVWMPIRRILAERYRIVSVDLRGSGASASLPGPYRIETFAADLADFVRTLGLEKLIVVGHSSGALIAQLLALAEPEIVAALVLIAPVPPSGWLFSPKIDSFMRSLPGNPENIQTWLKSLTAAPPSEENARLLREAAERTPIHAALEAYESWTHANLAERAARIKQPTLVLAPENDRPITPAVLREAFATLPNTSLSVLPQAGHYAYIDQPEQTAKRIAFFLSADTA